MYDGDSDSGGGRGWGWGANSKYSRVGNGDSNSAHRLTQGSASTHQSSRVRTQSSNASRIAEHHRTTSPRTVQQRDNVR